MEKAPKTVVKPCAKAIAVPAMLGCSTLGLLLLSACSLPIRLSMASPIESVAERQPGATTLSSSTADVSSPQRLHEGAIAQADGIILSFEQATIGGIALSMNEAAVRQRLGEPMRVLKDETECCGTLTVLDYPTLSLGLTEDGVFSYEITSSEMATADGVRVGDTRQKLVATYGQTGTPTAEWMCYVVEFEGSTLCFRLEGDRIQMITYDALLN
ncbi:hypothetical protein HPC62_06470 [Thermoleptolyngbya sichuanensis A183]|uniref:Uncharacterized protein n=2 Tax=Thermoleptolyngbya TaxID=2303528 RepID=A0A6M8BC43_9CYAN|nr:hypothetical protein [Thermoleptolyngbya sp. PKUAC-SCTB121]QKD81890.1 hypothetical protein HPC62_06470 [Thermoleptolyngbya sichuanensis A183]